MALMNWREANRVRWVGVRPGHDGEQIIESDEVIEGIKTIYTVPAGKTLFIFSYWFTSRNGAGGWGGASLHIYNGASIEYQLAKQFGYNVWTPTSVGVGLFVPIEVLTGYSIRLSADAGRASQGGFSGMVE